MKKTLFAFATLLTLGCMNLHSFSNTIGTGEKLTEDVPQDKVDVATLKERARQGDGNAYLKLADCYRDGIGVKRSFLDMTFMAMMAEQFGGIDRKEHYLESIPEESDFKLLYELMNIRELENSAVVDSLLEQLIAKGISEAYALKGMVAKKRGDSLEMERSFNLAAENNTSFSNAMMLLCGRKIATERLMVLAEESPVMNLMLADFFANGKNVCEERDSLVAHYYLKAAENASLSPRGARWLLDYHQQGGKVLLSETDIRCLQILTGEVTDEGKPGDIE